MPFLDASALETDPEGAAFLLAVLRWRCNPQQGIVAGRLGPLLGPHAIRLNRGLPARRRARKNVQASAGFAVSRQPGFRIAQPTPYQVKIGTGTRA